MIEYEELFAKTKAFIISLNKGTCLSSFYIGKAEDVELRHIKHQNEGYYKSVEIAHSNSSKIIDESERYLIERFKQEEIPIVFDNENNGGGGNPQADKLYVSLKFEVNSADELEDIDEDNFTFNSIKL